MAADFISKNYTINDVTIHTEEREGKSPALVLLHGVSMSGEVWSAQKQSDLLQDYKMILVEFPGHGASGQATDPDRDYSLPGYASVLKQLLPELTRDQYILAGYSLGGNAAIEAVTELENCIGIMAINTAITSKPINVGSAFKQNAALATIFKEDVDDDDELTNYAQAFFAPRNINTPNSLATDYKRTDPRARIVLKQSIEADNFEDETAILKNLNIPVALVTGQNDLLGDNTYLRNLDVPKWQNSTIEVPNAGHIPQLENSRFFDQALLDLVEYCKAQNG